VSGSSVWSGLEFETDGKVKRLLERTQQDDSVNSAMQWKQGLILKDGRTTYLDLESGILGDVNVEEMLQDFCGGA